MVRTAWLEAGSRTHRYYWNQILCKWKDSEFHSLCVLRQQSTEEVLRITWWETPCLIISVTSACRLPLRVSKVKDMDTLVHGGALNFMDARYWITRYVERNDKRNKSISSPYSFPTMITVFWVYYFICFALFLSSFSQQRLLPKEERVTCLVYLSQSQHHLISDTQSTSGEWTEWWVTE